MSAPHDARTLAERDLESINRLLETTAFESYFRRRLREMRAGVAKQLEQEQTEASTAALRTRLVILDEILAMPERDRLAHHSTLERSRG